MNSAKHTSDKKKMGRPPTGLDAAHTFRFEPEVLEQARVYATIRKITLNEAVNQALKDWLALPENREAAAKFLAVAVAGPVQKQATVPDEALSDVPKPSTRRTPKKPKILK